MSHEVAVATAVMTFPEACQAILDGQRVTRLEWDNRAVCVFLVDGLLKLRKADGSLHALLVSDGDMTGTDWVTVAPSDVPLRYQVHG